MSKRKKHIEEFLAAYESHFNDALLSDRVTNEDIAQSFESCFVESSPQGVECGKNDEQFLKKIQSSFDFYKGIGSTGMNIVSKEITLLDELHAMVKVYWRYSYMKDEREGAIDFTSYYLVTTRDQVKIFAFIAGDEQKALAENGLIDHVEAVVR